MCIMMGLMNIKEMIVLVDGVAGRKHCDTPRPNPSLNAPSAFVAFSLANVSYYSA